MSKMQNAPWYVGSNGATNFTRHEAQRFARQLLESAEYRRNLEKRVTDGTAPPAIEAMLWHYAYGKPIEQVEIQVSQAHDDLSKLSVEELQQRARDLARQLEEAQQLEDALPGEYRVQ